MIGGKCCKSSTPKTTEESGSNIGIIIIIVFALSVCCIFSSIAGGLGAYFFTQEAELPFDKAVFEYRTKRGKDGQTIIKPESLPIDIVDAYYLNLPISANKKNYKFIGKKCYNEVCDTLELKNTPAINLYYEDGNLMTGKLSYNE
jgi:hypothetical protein